MSFFEDSTAAVLRAAQRNLGHLWFNEPYVPNIIGVRSPTTTANRFDDDLFVLWREDNALFVERFAITTDPGTYWLQNPSKVSGTAVLVEGQYLNVWTIDLHQGKYEALCQRKGKVRVYRDANRDGVLDTDAATIEEGYFGINIHKAGEDSKQVDKWSAGCQVFKRVADFNRFMTIMKRARDKGGVEAFSYTLLTHHDAYMPLATVA